MNTTQKTELTKRDYENALFAWEGGACNPIALANHLYQAIRKMNLGSTETAKHPITRLYLAQLSYLAGIGIGECGNADDDARKIIEYWDSLDENVRQIGKGV